MSLESQVVQFNEVYGKEMAPVPKFPSEQEADLLHSLIFEELQETSEELDGSSIVKLAKELTDILYVTAQQMAVLGLPIDALLREVQRSNLSKLGADGKPIYREDGKVLKGPNYSEADIELVLGRSYD